jgi:hypothetical protein
MHFAMSETRPPAAPSTEPVTPALRLDASKALTIFVMIVAILYFGRDVMVPVTVAMLLAFVLAPLVNLLERLRLGRVTSVLGPSQVWGSSGNRCLRVGIVGGLESPSEGGTERSIVNGAAHL